MPSGARITPPVGVEGQRGEVGITPVGLDGHPLGPPKHIGPDPLATDDEHYVRLPRGEVASAQEGVEPGLERRANLTTLGVEGGEEALKGGATLAPGIAVPGGTEVGDREESLDEGLIGGLGVSGCAEPPATSSQRVTWPPPRSASTAINASTPSRRSRGFSRLAGVSLRSSPTRRSWRTRVHAWRGLPHQPATNQ